MSKIVPSSEQIARLVASIPEGFIRTVTYAHHFRTHNKGRRNLSQAVRNGKVGETGSLIFDAARLNADAARELAMWCEPSLPPLDDRGTVKTPPILERRAIRNMVFEPDATAITLLNRLADRGIADRDGFATTPDEEATLARLALAGALMVKDAYVYDPLRLSESTVDAIIRRQILRPVHAEFLALLDSQPGKTASLAHMQSQYGSTLYELMAMGGVTRAPVGTKQEVWLRLSEGDPEEAEKAALKAIRKVEVEARKRVEAAWEHLLETAGDVLRAGVEDPGKTAQARVLAHSYPLDAAAKRLSVRESSLVKAIRDGKLTPFTDPKRRQRIPAYQVEAAYDDPELGESITAPEVLNARSIALVSGVAYSTARSRLVRQNISTTDPTWGEVRGQWDLPDRLRDFRAILKVRKVEWREERQRRYDRMMAKIQLQEEEQRQRREQLREQLLGIFPNWENPERANQRVIVHVGPTNSGKTHDALQRLVEAGSGWYLAPLRLLAFEVFDRLNTRGVPCTLLTGEEYIPVPGARITAATIEMFNPMSSGDCVIIDEAHMFADPDRGAAWTRALMESLAPEVHVLGAPIVRPLIKRLTRAVALPMKVVEHERLTPIRVADKPWSMDTLPPRTILVAFSRRMVLGLKVELERLGRTVSVVYGNLPPEVRRRQAERFAAGECEICVATDAVGMGLNLPADNVCFFEVEKFDGRSVRPIAPHEVQQIGGRAGRHGLSQEGVVGALTWDNLNALRTLYYAAPAELTHAHVAPTVEAISLIPGTLAERLKEWSMLQSIPEALRSSLKTADMTERIELSAMLRDQEVQQLGLASALRLINAPTRQDTRDYWRRCASAILRGGSLPKPTLPPSEIRNHRELEDMETCILEADVYLWLANRQEFSRYATDADEVRLTRIDWSLRIDDALLRKIDTARRCVQCGNKLPYHHRYAICDTCHSARYQRYDRPYRR